MKINIERLKSNMFKVGEIGREKRGGITRLAFSQEFYEASSTLINLMEEAGLEITVDGVKNIFGKRKGIYNNLPSIMVGSHLDTVRNGGLFDGLLGVMAALECIYVLNENNIKTQHPIEIAAFNAEEGSEMGGTFGSRVMVGLQDLNQGDLESKLQNYGLTLESVKKSIRDVNKIKVFLELHIEQGAELYSKGIPIGIVEGIAGITRYKITARGEANHAGTTPMILRKDAMMGAAKLIVEIEKTAEEAGHPFVATIGTIRVFPGLVNVIPETAEFVVELRDLNQNRIENAVEKIKKAAEEIKPVEFDFQLLINKPPVMLNNDLIKAIEKICVEKDIKYQIMTSGAGHDAKAIARKIPTGMIFVPSREGKSHCPEEWTDWEDIKKGVEILLDTILEIDKNKNI